MHEYLPGKESADPLPGDDLSFCDLRMKAMLEIAQAYREGGFTPYSALYRAEKAMGITLGVEEQRRVIAILSQSFQDYL